MLINMADTEERAWHSQLSQADMQADTSGCDPSISNPHCADMRDVTTGSATSSLSHTHTHPLTNQQNGQPQPFPLQHSLPASIFNSCTTNHFVQELPETEASGHPLHLHIIHEGCTGRPTYLAAHSLKTKHCVVFLCWKRRWSQVSLKGTMATTDLAKVVLYTLWRTSPSMMTMMTIISDEDVLPWPPHNMACQEIGHLYTIKDKGRALVITIILFLRDGRGIRVRRLWWGH